MPQAQFRVIAQFVFVRSPKSSIKIVGCAIVVSGLTKTLEPAQGFPTCFSQAEDT
jgi:hypothetical protein